MPIAICREVSPSFSDCELTHLDREPIDLERARHQHDSYQEALQELGCEVHTLPQDADLPDSVFVEDAAVVLGDVAVLARPGAHSRRPEVESIGRALAPFRKLVAMEAPATLDGGDVLCLGKRIFVGRSTRSNAESIRQLGEMLGSFGYTVTGVDVLGCLHLKSAVCRVGPETLLIQRSWVARISFEGYRLLEVDPGEPFAANALLVNGVVIHPDCFPATRARLERNGIEVLPLDVSEIQKAEGGVTCCSLILA